jgi:ABC-type cobalamin/Fe3+-siderophores transport system ATPase subunit
VFQSRGKSSALVIATHDVELALSSADSILLLQRGRPARLAPTDSFAIDELSSAIGEG